MEKVMKEKLKKLFSWSLFRFAMVGALNTLLGMAIMFGLYNLAHCSYWFSSAANYVLTSILSFFLNKHFTFKNRADTPRQALLFAMNIAACYLVAYGGAKPVMRLLLVDASVSLRENVTMLTGMVIFTALNYIGQRLLVFSSRHE